MGNISSQEYKDVMKVLLEIKEDIGGVKNHLKNLNGSVARHEGAIEEHKKDMVKLENDTNEKITKIKVTLGKWAGGMTVVIVVLNAILFNAGTVV